MDWKGSRATLHDITMAPSLRGVQLVLQMIDDRRVRLPINQRLDDGEEMRLALPAPDDTDGRLSELVRQEVGGLARRSEEHTSELQSRETISYAVFCLKK